MSFTDSLWQRITDRIFPAILKHPFVSGLTTGKLAETSFRYYVIQDARYLKDFSRGLSILAAKSSDDDELCMFAEHARNAIVVERALHAGFIEHWGLSAEKVATTLAAPTNLLYTSYLLRVAYDRPYYEGLGAFLPCYWIYWEVGKHLLKTGSSNPLYQKWIDTYGGEEFAEVVRSMLSAVNRNCDALNPAQKESVGIHFDRSSKFEYMFWDMGYRREAWPSELTN